MKLRTKNKYTDTFIDFPFTVMCQSVCSRDSKDAPSSCVHSDIKAKESLLMPNYWHLNCSEIFFFRIVGSNIFDTLWSCIVFVEQFYTWNSHSSDVHYVFLIM